MAVVNASPLIFLSKGGYIDLLQIVDDRIWVPSPVANEILARGPDDVTARTIRKTSWITVVDPPDTPQNVASWDLGSGESSVLAVALERSCEAIIDDFAARRCAKTVEVSFRGTLGVVLGAKRAGHISEARPVVEDLLKNGMYLSRSVIEDALDLVDE